jgi:hypothetical protein
MGTRKKQLETKIHLLVSSEVWDLHDVQQGGLHEVMGPHIGDYI